MTASHDRASLFLEGGRRKLRDILSPEGVPLPMELADYGERAVALALDLFIWLCATLFMVLAFVLVASLLNWGHISFAVALGGILFVAFILRNFYFIHFELAWQGATPGKRMLGLRVVDRHGGPLLPAAVVARNLTREIETFLPLGILMSPLGTGTAGWEKLFLAAWLLLFVLLPFFNRDRLRAGDLIAGTMVVILPRRRLLGDLARQSAHYTFTDPQLRAYGAFELQVLEELLRHPDATEAQRVRRDVCDKISKKIAWPTPIPDGDVELFLREFYTAERAFLEREQLFGKRHPDKHSRDV